VFDAIRDELAAHPDLLLDIDWRIYTTGENAG
jgi:hypothetical protein